MPELPEVEVVRRSLGRFISGHKIRKVHVFSNKLRYKISKNFKKTIENTVIVSIKRRAKFLLINLSNNKTILLHLGMTGKVFLYNKKIKSILDTSFYNQNEIIKKHNHFIFLLSNQLIMIYNDVRKFGFVKLLNTYQVNNNIHLSNLGPEPLSKNFNYNDLKLKFFKSQKNIKNFLMDQKSVSGLGNINVNEILFYSSINPRILTTKLSKPQVLKIIKKTKKILLKSIQLGGSSIRDFKGTTGENGYFQQKFMVYGRENMICKRKKCIGKIKKINIGNRSSFFCNKCQN